jgi:uncharacterized membrane protein YheB (UPF0754 family)
MNERHIDGLVEACDTVFQALQLQQVLSERLDKTLQGYLENAITWKFGTEIIRLRSLNAADTPASS